MAASTSMFRRNLDDADHSLITFDRHTQDVGRNIDKLSGRLGLFVDLAATLGPALIPTATALVPLMAGLTNQLGFAAIAGGSTILAFQGVGDALKAVNEQAINPSTANLEKMHEAMATLGPAGRDFVRELQAMRPEMQKLQDAAQAGLFPGMTEGIQSLVTRMPEAERIIGNVSDTVGDLLARAGESLAGPEWDEFFQTLESEARPTLEALGESIGHVTKGLADMWIAFAPLNASFSQGMLDASKDFAKWADGLSATQGFQEFMDYLSTTGPQVAATLGALGGALLDVLEAAAPLGGPALAAITAFSKVISAIADSDLGTPILAGIAALRAYSLAAGLATRAQARFNTAQAGGFGATAVGAKAGGAKSWASTMARDLGVVTSSWASAGARTERESSRMIASTTRLKASLGTVGKGAAGLAALGIASTGAADKIGLTNTASLALMGTFIAPGWGTAIGAAAGGAIDLAHANDSLNDSLDKLNAMAGKVDFAAFNAQLVDAQKKVDDLKHVTGVGDWFSDAAKGVGSLVKGEGWDSIDESQTKIAGAQMQQAMADKWKGVANEVKAMGIAGALAADGFEQTAAGAKEAAMSVDQFTFSMRGASAALERMSNWDSFRGAVLDAKDAVAEAGKTLQKNGDIIRGQGRDMQRAGLESRGLLRNIAAQAIQTSEGMKNVANRTKFLDNARQSFIGVARSMGISRAAAVALANQLNLVDRINAQPTVNEKGSVASKARIAAMRAEIQRIRDRLVHMDEKGASAARARIGALRAEIAGLRSKTINVTTVVSKVNKAGYPGAGARGMLSVDGVRHYAYGDVANRHMPELAGPGPTRIWREPETMGEAYIPLADDDRRPRARAIAAETVSLLGGTAYFADGGLSFARGGVRGGGDDGDAARKHAAALNASTKAINREKNARERLVSKRDELSGSVRDTFMSDPFAGGSVWAAGAGDPRGILKADIAKANSFKHILAKLKSNGLDGDALAAIASTGDVGKAQALLGLGKTGIGQYETLYKQRASAASAVGKYAGQAAYGPAIATINKHLVALNKRVAQGNRDRNAGHKKTGDAVAKGVNKGAGSAKRGRR